MSLELATSCLGSKRSAIELLSLVPRWGRPSRLERTLRTSPCARVRKIITGYLALLPLCRGVGSNHRLKLYQLSYLDKCHAGRHGGHG